MEASLRRIFLPLMYHAVKSKSLGPIRKTTACLSCMCMNRPISSHHRLHNDHHDDEREHQKKKNDLPKECFALIALAGVSAGLLTRKKSTDDNSSPLKSMLGVPYKALCGVGLVAKCARPNGGGDGPRAGVPTIRERFNFIADVVEKASPAVVFITTRSYFKQGAGSGFIISEEGLIVTNAHVVQSARDGKVDVQLINGSKYTGVVEVIDRASDLALVKIEGENLPVLKLGSSSILRPGEWVVAVGSPLTLSNTVTSGIVSSTARNSSELGLHGDIDYIQTDAPITFGNSGGPLINLDGEAVGVNSMKVADGISFAIPSDYVQVFLTRASKYKKAALAKKSGRSAYVGLSMVTLTPSITAQLKFRKFGEVDVDRGVFIWRVYEDSPAEQAGLERYDAITKIDGRQIERSEDVYIAIEGKTHADFTVRRGGKELHFKVKPRILFK